MTALSRAHGAWAVAAVLALGAGCGTEPSGPGPGPTQGAPTGPEQPTSTRSGPSTAPTPTAPEPTTPEPTGTGLAGASGGGTPDPGLGPLPDFDPDPERTDSRAPSADAELTLTEVRTGRHVGFDRVVLELAGQGEPGWSVRYDDAPARQGSGAEVNLDGEQTLRVDVRGLATRGDGGPTPHDGPNPMRGAGGVTVTEVFLDGPFEGVLQAFVGTGVREPFRVLLVPDPVRVVVDVAAPMD